MDTRFCLETVGEALSRYGVPEVSALIRGISSPAKLSATTEGEQYPPLAWMEKGVGGTTSL